MSDGNVWYTDYDSAKRAGMGGDYITESGVYFGQIEQCICKTAKSGTLGFEFSFVSFDGQKANYMSIWTRKKDGTPIQMGIDKMNALAALLNLPDMHRVFIGTDEKGKQLYGFQEPCNKNIGIMLQKEYYDRNDGTEGYQFNILHFLDAETKQTYTEKTNNREAKTYKMKIGDKSANYGAAEKKPPVNPASNDSDDLPF